MMTEKEWQQVEVKQKPYALVTLKTLTIKRFDLKEDFVTAMNNMDAGGIKYIPLKYHHGAKTWFMPEVSA